MKIALIILSYLLAVIVGAGIMIAFFWKDIVIHKDLPEEDLDELFEMIGWNDEYKS